MRAQFNRVIHARFAVSETARHYIPLDDPEWNIDTFVADSGVVRVPRVCYICDVIRALAVRTAAIATLLLVIFLVAAALDLPLLDDPRSRLPRNRWALVAATTGLLIADIVLPAPSSLLMIANGAALGLWSGALASIAGSMGCAMAGYWLGRTGKLRDDGSGRAFLDRWGAAAVAASRPVPLLAEAVAIVAGSARLPLGRFTWSALAGCTPPAVLYAWAGAHSGADVGPGWPFALSLAFAGLLFLVGRVKR